MFVTDVRNCLTPYDCVRYERRMVCNERLAVVSYGSIYCDHEIETGP